MFSQSVIENLNYYVYYLKDPRNGEVFYIGKGLGNRIFNHIACADEFVLESEKLDRIREIKSSNNLVQHFVVRHGLSEKESFEIEAALIDFIGISNLSNIQGGHYSSDYGIKTTEEISAMYDAEELKTDEPIILININEQYRREMTTDELYEATRKSWVIGQNRSKATYAVPTYRGLTREVYKIDSWYSVPEHGKNRWGFVGSVADEEIRRKFRYKAIKTYFPKGAANPIRYVNC